MLFALIFSSWFYISYQCVQGVKFVKVTKFIFRTNLTFFIPKHDESKLKPMMIFMGVLAGLSLVTVISLSAAGTGGGLIGCLIYAHCYAVIYSLRERFREEFAQGVNRQINVSQNEQQAGYMEQGFDQQQQPFNPQAQQPVNSQGYYQP